MPSSVSRPRGSNISPRAQTGPLLRLSWGLAVLLCAPGCVLNKSRLATDQLVISDAVDRAVAGIDFSPLSRQKVYFDTKYLDSVRPSPVSNTEYLISSLRQQMVAYDLRLQDKREEADFIVEARVGVLGSDGHELTYGVPGSAALSTASVFLASPIPAPAMPELSLGRRNNQQGSAKIGVFAYDQATREPVWQAGIARGASRARDTWVFGLGPFESRGPVERRSWLSRSKTGGIGVSSHAGDPVDAYSGSVVFQRALERLPADEAKAEVQTAGHTEPAADKAASASAEGQP